jgi:hypothetical protein
MPKFNTTIDGDGPNGAWAMIAIPRSALHALDARARVPVCGTINGFAFRSSIMPRADGTYYMMVNKQMREGADARPGDTVTVVIERDDAPREVDIPPELTKAFSESAAARSRYDELSYSHRKEYAEWVASAKQEATRVRRAEKAIGMLSEGRVLKP